MKQIYCDGLQDLPIDAVEHAARTLERSAAWFPKVSEWRHAAKLERSNLQAALPPAREEPWVEECQVCLDSGWSRKPCYPGTAVTCGRPKCDGRVPGRAEHFYVVRCECRPTNRTFQRHHVYNTYA
jgi:hypothetical protein